MNTDLNLGPSHHGTSPVTGTTRPFLGEEAIDFDIHESLHSRSSPRLRHSQQYRESWRQVHGYTQPLPSHQSDISVVHHPHFEPVLRTSREDVGEGSNAAAAATEIRNREVVKICDNNNKNLTESDKNAKNRKRVEEDTIKGSDRSGGGFFDCNICLELAKEPVVTGCGHLFCWPCLYKWLYIHSCAKECPICKGTVSTDSNVTPIYGRGKDSSTREPDEDNSGIKIPERPPAKGRIEHKRPSVVMPTTESFIQHDGGGVIDWEGSRHTHVDLSDYDRHISLVNMFQQVREQNRVDRPNLSMQNAVISGTMPDISETERRVISRINRISNSYYENNASVMSQLIPTLADQTTTTTTRADDESFLQPQQDREPLPPIDDRDSSFSSVAAAIHGEIDPSMSLSTSSSRRRNDMDSGDSRNSRRRRLN